MMVGAFVLIVVTMVLFSVGGASAHSMYTGKRNPVTSESCCGINDCRPFPEERVQVVPGGYMTSLIGGGVEYIPEAETLPSMDGRYHRCEVPIGPDAGRRRCFMVPPQAF